MEILELVNELRNLLPPKVDYAELVCAESFGHGCCYVWEDPEPYIIENAANVIESQQAEIDRLKHENEQLRELLRLALQDLKVAADDNGGCYGCTCLDENEKCTSVQGKIMCDCKTNNMWQWRFSGKLKESGVEV